MRASHAGPTATRSAPCIAEPWGRLDAYGTCDRCTAQAVCSIRSEGGLRAGRAWKDQFVARQPERPSERIEADMRRRIASGEWQSGDQLPSVAALAEHYRVAGGTVARVLRKLSDDGLVRVVAGWG